MPFKRKPKDEDDDNNGKDGTKPKIIRGLGGGADCKSWGWATFFKKTKDFIVADIIATSMTIILRTP